MVGETVKFLKENIKESPQKILDVACGYGGLVGELSSAFPHSTVYGLDINRESLAYGIAKGNFKKAVPIHGNAYHLGEENPGFTLVHFDPQYLKGEHAKLEKIEHRELKENLTGFGLVTAVNPFNKIPQNLFYLFQLGKLKEAPVSPDVISRPAKKGGHVLYEIEIAHQAGMFYRPVPSDITEKCIENFLDRMRKESDKSGLEYVSHNVINKGDSKDLAVLFKKL
jgi:SAM-dependent methyltransferase